MRNAAVSFDDAFDDGPTRKTAARKRRPASGTGSSRKAKPGPAFREKLHKVARYGAIGMSATLALAIMSNALLMQKGRHPAPLFGKSFVLASNAAPVAAKAPVAKPAPAQNATTQTAPTEAATLGRLAKPDPSTSAPPPASMASDPIGRLLRDGSIAAPEAPSDVKKVLGAQRALVKLGFMLKPNGTLGPQTKKAIERFEKERHLPVNGELTPRLIKSLAAESGTRID